MNQRKQIIIGSMVTILWTAVIFTFSSQEGTVSSDTSGRLLTWLLALGIPISEHILRKTAHVFIYFVLGVCGTFTASAIFQNSSRWRYKGSGLAGILYSSACACIDEWNQFHTSGRSGQLSDVGIDSIGFITGSLGVVLLLILLRRHRAQILE